MSCQLAPLALVRACYHTQSDQLHVQCGLADSFNAAEAVGTGSATLAELPPPHRRRSFRLAGEGSVCLAAPPLPPRSVLQGHRSYLPSPRAPSFFHTVFRQGARGEGLESRLGLDCTVAEKVHPLRVRRVWAGTDGG